jgi:hypothetical protein
MRSAPRGGRGWSGICGSGSAFIGGT